MQTALMFQGKAYSGISCHSRRLHSKHKGWPCQNPIFMLFIAAGAFHVSKISDLIPELQGRFPIKVKLNPLTVDDYKRILHQPEHAITKQYAALLATDDVALEFRDDALDAIAQYGTMQTKQRELGARRLHTIVENLLEGYLVQRRRRSPYGKGSY